MLSKVNGWSNYFTWSVHIWLDQTFHAETRLRIRKLFDEAEKKHPRKDRARDQTMLDLADEMKARFEETFNRELEAATITGQILSRAVGEVCWEEVARYWINEEINNGALGARGVEAFEDDEEVETTHDARQLGIARGALADLHLRAKLSFAYYESHPNEPDAARKLGAALKAILSRTETYAIAKGTNS